MSALLSAILIAANLFTCRCPTDDVGVQTGQRDLCPVTIANGQAPPGVESSPNFHGNRMIFIAVPEDGIERALHDPRGYGGYDKLIFFRLPIGAELDVTVAPFGPRESSEPAEVTRSPGQEQFIYQVSGVWFPFEGCWSITGRTSESSLTIIVDVVFVDPAVEATPTSGG